MTSALNIRDIGDGRKQAIADEARLRGIPVAELVRQWIDSGLDAARRERDRAEWCKAALPGVQSEQQFLQSHGPTLARYRTGRGTDFSG